MCFGDLRCSSKTFGSFVPTRQCSHEYGRSETFFMWNNSGVFLTFLYFFVFFFFFSLLMVDVADKLFFVFLPRLPLFDFGFSTLLQGTLEQGGDVVCCWSRVVVVECWKSSVGNTGDFGLVGMYPRSSGSSSSMRYSTVVQQLGQLPCVMQQSKDKNEQRMQVLTFDVKSLIWSADRWVGERVRLAEVDEGTSWSGLWTKENVPGCCWCTSK